MDLPLEIVGRVNILKIIYLPKLLYIVANSPCPFLKQIDAICATFLWHRKSPRITLEVAKSFGVTCLSQLLHILFSIPNGPYS